MSSENNTYPGKHQPVLLAEVLKLLAPQQGQKYLDLTAGYGGHAAAVFAAGADESGSVLVDRDQAAIDQLKRKFKKARIMHSDFVSAARKLLSRDERFDCILADLGMSSPQVDEASRGFSFRQKGELDMRMDRREALTAAELVNKLPVAELADIIASLGEEANAGKIARAIARQRPISDTSELAELIKQLNPRRGRIHPATKTFQALRIAVNKELEQLEAVLPLAVDLLADDGRLAVISFHSLEDRRVKHFLKEESQSGYESRLKLLTKKPISAKNENNPRARSAKLRAAAKTKTKKKGA